MTAVEAAYYRYLKETRYNSRLGVQEQHKIGLGMPTFV